MCTSWMNRWSSLTGKERMGCQVFFFYLYKDYYYDYSPTTRPRVDQWQNWSPRKQIMVHQFNKMSLFCGSYISLCVNGITVTIFQGTELRLRAGVGRGHSHGSWLANQRLNKDFPLPVPTSPQLPLSPRDSASETKWFPFLACVLQAKVSTDIWNGPASAEVMSRGWVSNHLLHH